MQLNYDQLSISGKNFNIDFTFLFQATPVPKVSKVSFTPSSVPKEVKTKKTPPIKTAEVSYTKSTYLYTF